MVVTALHLKHFSWKSLDLWVRLMALFRKPVHLKHFSWKSLDLWVRPMALIQAGVFWNHIRLGGAQCAPPPSPLFLLYLWSNYNQTWYDGTLGQNLSKVIKILLTSSLGGKYDVIKPFLVSYNSSSLIFCPTELKFVTGVNSRGADF